MSLKFSLFYDIACPRSWVFYQVLQKKIPSWKLHRGEFTVEYFPVSRIFLYRQIYNTHPAGIISCKKDYMLRELYDTCDFYDIPKADFEVTYSLEERRTRSTLLLLNAMRRKWPSELYQKFLERIFYGFWHNSEAIKYTFHYFRIGRELGIPFKEMDDIVMQIESRDNYMDGGQRVADLIIDERITDIPWFRVDSVPGNQKLLGFTDIIRLEWMDELMAQPFFNPLNHNVGNPLFHSAAKIDGTTTCTNANNTADSNNNNIEDMDDDDASDDEERNGVKNNEWYARRWRRNRTRSRREKMAFVGD